MTAPGNQKIERLREQAEQTSIRENFYNEKSYRRSQKARVSEMVERAEAMSDLRKVGETCA